MNRADPNEIYALLEQQNIPYRKIEHPAAASMEQSLRSSPKATARSRGMPRCAHRAVMAAPLVG